MTELIRKRLSSSHYLAGTAVVLLGLAYVVLFETGVHGCCFSGKAVDLDIRTGRQRVSTFLFGRNTREIVTDTWLSQSLPSSLLTDNDPDWRRTSKVGWFDHHSPTYAFGGCQSQIRQLEKAASIASFTPMARQSVSLNLLSVWQRSETCFDAREYVNRVFDMAMKANERGATVDESDLTEPPVPK